MGGIGPPVGNYTDVCPRQLLWTIWFEQLPKVHCPTNSNRNTNNLHSTSYRVCVGRLALL